MAFHVLAERWHDFFLVAGTAAATLVGLLFVGLSLHLREILSRSEMRSLARVTLANFGAILLVALFMEVPQGSTGAAVELLVSGIFALSVLAGGLIVALRSRTRTIPLVKLISRFGLSAMGYAGLIVAGSLLRGGSDSRSFNWLVGVTVLLLVVSLRNSWDLLVSMGAATFEAALEDPEGPDEEAGGG